MVEPRSFLRHASRHVLAAGAVVCLALVLGGCAARHDTGASTAAALAPESNPSSEAAELRRRARIRLELAANYLEMGQTQVALEEVQQAISTDPSFGDGYNLRGLVFMRLGDWPSADDSFRRALDINPQEPYLLHNYGRLRCQQKNYAEAGRFFDRALAVPSYTARAKTLMTQGLCQSARDRWPRPRRRWPRPTNSTPAIRWWVTTWRRWRSAAATRNGRSSTAGA